MSGTHLFYNGVLLRDCKLIEFQQAIEYDAESQTDPLFSRYRISVESRCISLHSTDPEQNLPELPLNTNPIEWQPPSTAAIKTLVAGETLVDRMRWIQEALESPRKDFWFALNAVTHKPLSQNQPAPETPAETPDQNDSYRILLAACGIDDFAPTDGEQGRTVSGRIQGGWMLDTTVQREDVVDMNNGPKPQSVSISEITGGRYMRVQFSIEVCRPLCAYHNEPTSGHPIRDAEKVVGVISNRWGITESLNENWETEISVSGTLRVKDHRWKPDAMRLMTSCALFPYAKITRRQFATSADGLTLKYQYSLKQAGIAPPPGVIDWSGTYKERVQNGGVCTGSISVKVRGTHEIPTNIIDFDGQPIRSQQRYKLYLTDWLFKIIEARFDTQPGFNVLPGQQADNIRPMDIVVTENMKEPEVEANVSVRHTSDDLARSFSLRLHKFGQTVYNPNDPAILPLLANWDERDWPLPPAYTWTPRGTREDGSVATEYEELGSAYDCYFQNPCSEWHAKPEGWNRSFEVVDRDQESGEDAENGAETYLYSGGPDQLPTEIGQFNNPANPATYGWSALQLAGFSYLHCEIENDYQGHAGRIALPLSRVRSGASSTTGSPETAVAIAVHAGIQKRTFRMHASRQGAWPVVPIPRETVQNSTLGITETLLSSRVIPEAPKLAKDGRTWEYSAQVLWEYVLSRPISPVAANEEYYRVPSDPRDKTTPTVNRLGVTDFFDGTGTIEQT